MALRSKAMGTVEGTGSAINIPCGFQPNLVRLINIDGDAILDWTSDMGAGKGYKTVAAGTNALIATGGITAYTGSEGSESEGFTIGADADVNASAETIVWVAEALD
jgi:hypothetical protein